MRLIRLQSLALALSLLAFAGFVTNISVPTVYAQTTTTGAVSGVVADSTGAVVPGAKVVVTDAATAAKQTVLTNAEGRYTVGLLKPGLYKISAATTGMQSQTEQVTIFLGATSTADIKVTPTADQSTIEVTATTLPLVDTQNVALATTFNEEQIEKLPTPGGDVTTVAFTAPGVVVNVGGEFGNFSSDGLPGISNLFILNGYDNQDPFLNLNNSGSSNLTLGQGELAESTVIQNAYNSQYGRAGGAILSYTTKSGGNKFHGEADYNYNGTVLNANGWFNEYDQVANGLANTRPHAVSNEWAANVGGPIIKDKLFFFSDYEGLHYVLPGASGFLTFPSPALQTYILANVPADAESFYTKALADFNKSSAYASAIPVTNGTGSNQDGNGFLGCGDPKKGGLAGTPTGSGGTFGVDTPCMVVGSASANNINQEWLYTQRIDWNVNDKQKIWGRYKMDRGTQPTNTSFIDPLFSALSVQPAYEGQFNHTYIISPSKTNSLVLAGNWYTAYFGPANLQATLNELPMNLYYTDYGLDGSGVNGASGLPELGLPFYLTQGRNVTQYQIVDDFSWIKGKHTLKFGGDFRRDLVSDYDAQEDVDEPYATLFSLGDFAAGTLSGSSPWYGYNAFTQAYDNALTAHLALYNLGTYVQDEYQVTPKLKLTLGVRVDRTGNPYCKDKCFSEYPGSFPASGTSWSDAINPANSLGFPGVQKINFQPRFGFDYAIDDQTEIRGGAGLFTDLYPAGFLDDVIQNFPNYNQETILTGDVNTAGATAVGTYAAAANTAVQSGFASGASPASVATALYAEGVPFTPPSVNAYFPGKYKVPDYAEYSLQIERQLSKSDAVFLTYAGNYGSHEFLSNQYQNASNGAYSDGLFNTASASNIGNWVPSPAGSFGSGIFNVAPADPRFARVTALTSNGHSNYNGGMLGYKHTGQGLTGQLSYTYSHSLDTISNGGQSTEPYNNGSLFYQLTPNMQANNLNYSNSDYDVRHNLTGDAVYDEPYKSTNKILDNVLGGWTIGVKTYLRTGEPFSIVNGGVLGSSYTNLGNELIAQPAPGFSRVQIGNPTAINPHSCISSACIDINEFVPYTSQQSYGNLRRNAFFGPHYNNTDMSVMKKIAKSEGFTLEIGANAYNVFNHVNFANPGAVVGASNSNDVSISAFGTILGTVAPPTSPYGSFQGAAVTQRVLQVHGKITF